MPCLEAYSGLPRSDRVANIPDCSFVPKRKSIGSDVGLYARPVNGRRTRAISQSGIAHNAPAESIGGLLDIQAQNLVLTKSQAACLIPLRQHKDSKPEIAIQAKLDLTKTAAGLGALARIGLASQTQSKKWYTTTSGKACRFKVLLLAHLKIFQLAALARRIFNLEATRELMKGCDLSGEIFLRHSLRSRHLT